MGTIDEQYNSATIDGPSAYINGVIRILVSWDFPATSNNPDKFEVMLYTGEDPDDLDARVIDSITIPGNHRSFKFFLSPNEPISDIQAAVRAIYD